MKVMVMNVTSNVNNLDFHASKVIINCYHFSRVSRVSCSHIGSLLRNQKCVFISVSLGSKSVCLDIFKNTVPSFNVGPLWLGLSISQLNEVHAAPVAAIVP